MEVSDADREALMVRAEQMRIDLIKSRHGQASFMIEDLLKALSTQAAELDALRGEVERLNAIYHSPTGDNHHNAARCPYCRPEYEQDHATIAQLRDRVADLKRFARHKSDAWGKACKATAGLGACDCGLAALLSQNEVG